MNKNSIDIASLYYSARKKAFYCSAIGNNRSSFPYISLDMDDIRISKKHGFWINNIKTGRSRHFSYVRDYAGFRGDGISIRIYEYSNHSDKDELKFNILIREQNV